MLYVIKHQIETDFAFPEIGNHRSSKFGEKIFRVGTIFTRSVGLQETNIFIFFGLNRTYFLISHVCIMFSFHMYVLCSKFEIIHLWYFKTDSHMEFLKNFSQDVAKFRVGYEG